MCDSCGFQIYINENAVVSEIHHEISGHCNFFLSIVLWFFAILSLVPGRRAVPNIASSYQHIGEFKNL